MPGKSMAKQEEDFQAEDDARTLMRAEEIRNSPKRLKKAKGKLEKQRKEAQDAEKRNKLEQKVAKKLKDAT